MKPVFETQRLIGGRWSLDLAEATLAIYSDPKVTEHMPALFCDSLEAAQDRIQWSIDRNANWSEPLGSWPVFLKDTNELIGNALLKYLPDADGNFTDDLEIGWHLGSQQWGHGYATEFGMELLRLGFASVENDSILAVTGLKNKASQSVCHRLGMTHRGQTDKYYGQTVEWFEIRRDEFARR